MNQTTPRQADPEAVAPALEVRDLVRKFGSLTAVDHLTLSVRRGEILGILGPNGAGKTTSIRMMCGLLKPDSGDVWIEGRKLRHPGSGGSTRAQVGICPQENILWSKLTCFEQLVFSARMYDVSGPEARKRADALLDRMGLAPKRNKLAATLSGGMKRRMNVILALMHDPNILVFDEPEAGLDPQSRVLVREFIRETSETRTVIVTTHNMDEADRLADRVAIIDSGRLLKLDTPEQLKRSIGHGDTLEIRATQAQAGALSEAARILSEKGFSASATGDQLRIRTMDLVPRIPEVYQLLGQQGIGITEMRLRENTLEDVFIQLTGKTLRS